MLTLDQPLEAQANSINHDRHKNQPITDLKDSQPENYHKRLKEYNHTQQDYALTRSRLDLVARGVMRSMSKDQENCHSCLSAWDSVFYGTLALESIYFNWSDSLTGVDGSYRIFAAIVDIYEKMAVVELKCKQREIAYTIRNRTLLQYNLFQNMDFVELIDMVFLLQYGLWWG